MGFESNVTDYLDFMQKKLRDKSLDDVKALQTDLEKYKNKDDCSDAEFKEMQEQNRYLLNRVFRLEKENKELKAVKQ